MRKLATFVVLVSMVLAIPVFGQSRGAPQPTAPKGPPTFVEEPVPEGKAIIYIYNTRGGLIAPQGQVWAQEVIFSKSGLLLTILPSQGYFPFVTDPGTVQLSFLIGSGGQYGAGMIAAKFVMEAAAGQAYFLTLVPFKGLQVLPAEKAKTDDEILYCTKIE